jgi:hypothetical protein
MKLKRSIAVIASVFSVVIASCAVPISGWSPDGHMVITTTATHRLLKALSNWKLGLPNNGSKYNYCKGYGR